MLMKAKLYVNFVYTKYHYMYIVHIYVQLFINRKIRM